MFGHRQLGSAITTLLICLILVGATAIVVWLIFSTEPVAQKDGATKKSPMLVDVLQVEQASYTPLIQAMGVVRPAKSIELKPRVSGQILEVSEQFVPGSIVEKGEWLVRLDTQDYQLAVDRAEAELIEAQAAFDIEMGEQERARRAYEMLNRDVSPANKALILREPQKKQAEASLKSAQSALAEAKLALERTAITMPFTGQVLSRDANLGSQVSGGDRIAMLVGTQQYWVEATVPLAKVAQLARPNNNIDLGVNIEQNDQSGIARSGLLKQIIAELDDETRMAKVLVEVDDPLSLLPQNKDQPPLIAGAFVATQLPAKTLDNVVRLPIEYLRKGNTVWVKQEQQLDIRQVNLAFKDRNYAYIDDGLVTGEMVITTDLATVRQGASVRLKSSVLSPDAAAANNETGSTAQGAL